ncbi:MAG: hypothetical protein GY734_03310 [Herbaspirillum sp.]|nr:hypothetical protein [Herbaspirillum sp.]
MLNMIADPRGPGRSRGGFKYIGEVDGNTARSEYIGSSLTAAALMVLTDLKMTMFGLGGAMFDKNFIVESNFENGGADWSAVTVGTASVGFITGACTITPEADSANISQAITTDASGLHFLRVVSQGTAFQRIMVGTGVGDGTYYDVVTSEALHEAEFILPGTAATVTISCDGAAAPQGDESIINYIGVSDDLAAVSFVTPYAESELDDIHMVFAEDGLSTWFLHPSHPVYRLDLDPATFLFTWTEVAFTGQPAEWTGSNWPGSGDIFDGRLYLGGTPAQAQQYWGSKTGVANYEDFTIGVADDDAFTRTIAKQGAIAWIKGTKNLLIGTVNGEHIVDSEGAFITPTDNNIKMQSSYGSNRTQPHVIGDQVMYISADATKLRAMQYEWSKDNWQSNDLTFFSEHITKARITDMAWAQNPHNLIVMALKSGSMAWLSYERGENIWGWHRHDTAGHIVDVSSGLDNGTNVISICVQRVDGSIYIESIPAVERYNMDSWHSQSNAIPFTVVTGLDHLEGEEVQVLTNGAVHPDRVVAGGQINLQREATHAVVGLKFTPKIVSLPLDKGSQTGSAIAHAKKYNAIVVGLLDSAIPLVNGERIPSRHPATPMGEIEPLTSGQISQIELGWTDDAIVTIEQDLPLPLTVLYIGGDTAQELL